MPAYLFEEVINDTKNMADEFNEHTPAKRFIDQMICLHPREVTVREKLAAEANEQLMKMNESKYIGTNTTRK